MKEWKRITLADFLAMLFAHDERLATERFIVEWVE